MAELKYVCLDCDKLDADITEAAERYDLNCTVYVIQNCKVIYGCSFGDGPSEAVLDCAGGMMLGLSVMALCDDGCLSLSDTVGHLISGGGEYGSLTVESLLKRNTGLPDPLRQRLLTEMYGDPEYYALDGDEQLRCEETAMLAGRDYVSAEQVLKSCDGLGGCDFAPSSADEILLRSIVTRAAGMSIEEYQRQRIFETSCAEVAAGVPQEQTGFITGSEGNPISYTPGDNTTGLYTVSEENLLMLLFSLAEAALLSGKTWDTVRKLAGGHTLPFSMSEGFLCGRSCAAGWSVDVMLEHASNIGAIIISKSPLPCRADGDVYRRFDLDVMGCINSQRIYPAGTRIERISARNITGVLAVETDPDQREFTASPAADIAMAAADRRQESFAITEHGVTVGLLSLTIDPAGNRARIKTLLIDRRYRRRRFGATAVYWAMGYLRHKQVREVVLCVQRRNHAARELYAGLGFEVRAVYPDALVMGLEI